MNINSPFIIPNYDFSKKQKLCLSFTESQSDGPSYIPLNYNIELIIPDDMTDVDEYEASIYYNYKQRRKYMYFYIRKDTNQLRIVTSRYGTVNNSPSNNTEIYYELLDTQMPTSFRIYQDES